MRTARTVSGTPRDNRLLAALPENVYETLLPFLEPVSLPLAMAVYESGARQRYMYFPTSGIVSLLYVLENGSSAEIAVTGNEGLVGISLFMGGETTPSRAVVQSAVATVLAKLGIPSKADIEALSQRMSALSRQLKAAK